MNNKTASFAQILRSYREATGDRRSTLDLPPTVLSRLLLQAHKLSRCATVRSTFFKRIVLTLRAGFFGEGLR